MPLEPAHHDSHPFAERFARNGRPSTHVERVAASRRQSFLPIFEPPPPHTVHSPPAAPPGPVSAGIQPPPVRSSPNGSLPITGLPDRCAPGSASVGRSDARPRLAGPSTSGGPMDDLPPFLAAAGEKAKAR